jgi:tetratricopeptide (TPR) repeat protein
MTFEAKIPLSTRKRVSPPPPSRSGPAAAHHDSLILQHYQGAVQLMQQAKFDKAMVAFEKLLTTAAPPLAERARMYIVACHRQLDKTKLEFATPEEQYDYAVSLLNLDYYEEARDQFHTILGGYPNADFALYGLAVLDAITGQTEECLDHLSRAIDGNPRNRLQARTDTDFQTMVDDPRFTELLYPEIP